MRKRLGDSGREKFPLCQGGWNRLRHRLRLLAKRFQKFIYKLHSALYIRCRPKGPGLQGWEGKITKSVQYIEGVGGNPHTCHAPLFARTLAPLLPLTLTLFHTPRHTVKKEIQGAHWEYHLPAPNQTPPYFQKSYWKGLDYVLKRPDSDILFKTSMQ